MSKSDKCVFGIIFAKWRRPSTIIETKVTETEDIIKCICLFNHNFINLEEVQHHLAEVVVMPVPERRKKKLEDPQTQVQV